MKNLIYLLIAVVVSLGLPSCEKFLEEQSPDLLIPEEVKDYAEMFNGEVYLDFDANYQWLDVMSDDGPDVVISLADLSGYGAKYRGYYTWQEEPELEYDGRTNYDHAWTNLYKRVMLCNIALDELNGLDGKQDEKDYLLGEAHFMRAFAYFYLVNLYGEPYVAASASSDLGVPLHLLPSPLDQQFTRSSVQDVYKQIELDLLAAKKMFENCDISKSIFHANINASNLMLSRVYLFMKDWDNVILYSNQVLENKSTIYDLSGDVSYKAPFYHTDNPEILFSYGQNYPRTFETNNLLAGETGISQALSDLYTENDNRKILYLGDKKRRFIMWTPAFDNKRGYADNNLRSSALRVSEAYLNRAEAYAEKGDEALALSDVVKIRSLRINGDPQEGIQGLTIVEKVRNERRIEFVFERMRWFDLRRWERPRIEHIHKGLLVKSGWAISELQKFVLEENDPAYTLQIPILEREVNSKIELINRPARVGEDISNK